MTSFGKVWQQTLYDILSHGNEERPRGIPTKEIIHRAIKVNMREPVLTIPSRKLSYQFMAAEAHWILAGDDRVETIAPYNKNIAQFSDDGERFFGAYGPKIVSQLEYVVAKLREDPNSRQAGLTIWRENPPDTKDVPCTVAIFFTIRNSLLDVHVFMRSSDAWLGLPYDVFNFSMLGHYVCALINRESTRVQAQPNLLHLTAASSHLYERDFAAAASCLADTPAHQLYTPSLLYIDPEVTISWLEELRRTKPGDPLRWWEVEE